MKKVPESHHVAILKKCSRGPTIISQDPWTAGPFSGEAFSQLLMYGPRTPAKRTRRASSYPSTRLPKRPSQGGVGLRKYRPLPPAILNIGTGFPKQVKFTHKYCEFFNNVSTSGVPQAYRFRANGMFDPNHTGTGHQPLFFDQLGAIYDQYTVISSKITVSAVPSASSTVPQQVGININDDAVGIAAVDINTINEQTESSFKQIAYTPEAPVMLTRYWSALKSFGANPLANSELRGTLSSDPTEQMFFVLYSAAIDGASTVGIWCTVTIEYTAIWNELKDISSS